MGEWTYRLLYGVRVSVRARSKPTLLAGFLGPETSESGPVTLVLDLAPGKEEVPGVSLAVGRTDGSVAVRGFYKAIPWSCRVSERADGGLDAGFRSPLQREYLALHIVLIPLLRRLLLDRGVAMVSGAAFELDGEATLLAGPTGQGKTALLLGALERGARLIGDEYLGLTKDGVLVPVGRVIALRRETLARAPRMRERLAKHRKAALRVSGLLSRITAGRVEPLVHVAPIELGLDAVLEPRASLHRFFWLAPQAGSGWGVGCETVLAGEAVGLLSIMQAAHDLWYGDIGSLLGALGGGRAESEYGSRWRETVERGLAGAQCWRLAFPAGEGAQEDVLDHVVPRRRDGGA